MTADRIVVIATVAAAAFALGIQKSEPAPVICPDKAPGETLISITINGPTTICTYASPYGRALRKAKA